MSMVLVSSWLVIIYKFDKFAPNRTPWIGILVTSQFHLVFEEKKIIGKRLIPLLHLGKSVMLLCSLHRLKGYAWDVQFPFVVSFPLSNEATGDRELFHRIQ